MGELLVTFGEDGKAHMYDSDFDVTIHCENEQQMNEAVELLHLANRMHWRKTAEPPPTEKDAAYGKVIAIQDAYGYGEITADKREKLTDLWEAREAAKNSRKGSDKYTELVTEMLEVAIRRCGEEYDEMLF